jgi:hypothetical protein
MGLHPKASLVFLLLPPMDRGVPKCLIGFVWFHSDSHDAVTDSFFLIPVMFTVESGALSDSATSENDPVAIPSRPR